MKHLEQDELALHYFGDDSPAEHAAAEAHLNECAACKADFEAMSLTLATVREAQPPVPEKPANYEEQVWNSIRAHLPEREKKSRLSWIAQPRQWAIAGAMAVIIVAAFLAGRFSTKPSGGHQPNVIATNNTPSVTPGTPNAQGPEPPVPTNPTGTPPETGAANTRPPRSNPAAREGSNAVAVNAPQQHVQTRDRILLVAVGDHLEKSQMVLMELVNAAPENGHVDIASEQQRAEDLLNSNRLYRMTAQEVGDRKLANVLDELERMLVQIAHEPAKVNSEELKDLQRRIEAQGLLFKVRVVGANIRDQKKQGPKPKATRPRAKSPEVTEKRQSI
jgi:hypothetical protein